MKGCRAISDDEIRAIASYMNTRNSCIFILGIRTGFRIAELLSLNVEDVLNSNGTVKDFVKVHKRNMKGKLASRIMPLHKDAKDKIFELTAVRAVPLEPLFRGRRLFGKWTRYDSTSFHRALKKACGKAGINSDRIASHSMRKTFAAKMYPAVDKNIYKLKELLGHKNISATGAYIEVNVEELMEVVLKMK